MRAEAGRQQAAQRGRIRQPWVWGILGLVVGIALGIFYAWQINPVVLTDVDPVDLRQDWKEAWVLMAADSYSIRQDPALAERWFSSFPEEEQRRLLTNLHQAAAGNPEQQQRFEALAAVLAVELEAGPTAVPEEAAETAPAAEEGGLLRTVLTACAIGLLVLLILLVGARILVKRRRQAGELRERPATPTDAEGTPSGRRTPAEFDLDAQPGVATEEVEVEAFGAELFQEELEEEPAPDTGPMPALRDATSLGKYTSRYEFQQDHYDVSFSIETSDATFFGECGVSISEVIADEPYQHVTAFEVWLFDKDDIRTVTKVLMSPYAWEEDGLRARLTDRGELVLVDSPGQTFELETNTLYVRAQVQDVAFGESEDLPPKSFFDRLELELEPFVKAGGGESETNSSSITF